MAWANWNYSKNNMMNLGKTDCPVKKDIEKLIENF